MKKLTAISVCALAVAFIVIGAIFVDNQLRTTDIPLALQSIDIKTETYYDDYTLTIKSLYNIQMQFTTRPTTSKDDLLDQTKVYKIRGGRKENTITLDKKITIIDMAIIKIKHWNVYFSAK